jgi:hypothetical protein
MRDSRAAAGVAFVAKFSILDSVFAARKSGAVESIFILKSICDAEECLMQGTKADQLK